MGYPGKGIGLGKVQAIKETELALLVRPQSLESPEPFWVPKSQIHEDSEVWIDGHHGFLHVTEWWAEQKGFL